MKEIRQWTSADSTVLPTSMAAFCVTKVKGPEGEEELATENIAWVDGGNYSLKKCLGIKKGIRTPELLNYLELRL